MFTGLIQVVGTVLAADRTDNGGMRLRLEAPTRPATLRRGDSVAVAGCCLTLADEPHGSMLTMDVIPETLACTTLGTWGPGRRVNLEWALPAGGPIGGHFVQGHIEGVGTVEQVRQAGSDVRLSVRAPRALFPAIVPKGAIALDGVSLTIAAVDRAGALFDVALIPTTLARTTLGDLRRGDAVNIETDIIARAVVHNLRPLISGPTAPPMADVH